MTLSTTSSRISYVGDGVTTVFPIPFKMWTPFDISVYTRPSGGPDTQKAYGTDYNVSAIYPGTGNLIATVAPAVGQTLIIEREMPFVQELDLIASGDFAAENIETALDKIVGQIQTLRDMLSRAPLLPVGSPVTDAPLPEMSAANANKALGLDATGLNWMFLAAQITNALATTFGLALMQTANAAAARALLEVPWITDLGNLALVNARVAAATLTFASTLDNAVSTVQTVAVPGARPGDQCFAQAEGTILTTVGASLDAKCLVNDVVSVYLVNDSGSTFAPVAQIVNVMVLPALV